MKTSRVFMRVKEHLCDGGYMFSHERFICYAIDYLYYKAKVIRDRDRTRCKKIVRELLGLSKSLEAWLWTEHGIVNRMTPAYQKKIMATRKAWLDHLINHYEAKGD